MKSTLLVRFKKYILHFLQLQIFISLAAFPILLCWGLPLSILSPIGNLIFGPPFTLFLFFSSLLFFTELLHIPNTWIAWLLEHITNLWLYVMHLDSHPWLFGFVKPGWLFIFLVPICALLILHFKKFKHPYYQVGCFIILLVSACFYIKIAYSAHDKIDTLACGRGSVTMLHHQDKLVLIDPGVIGQRISATSWIEYTLLTHILKTSGKTTIDYLILLQPSATLFEAINTLVNKIKVKKIYLICWQGSMEKHEWRRFFEMKRAIEEKNVILERISHNKIILGLSPTATVAIKPLDKQIKQKEISYPAIEIKANLNDKKIAIFSYKYKKSQSHTIDKNKFPSYAPLIASSPN